jgi:K+ transporter
VFIVSLIDYLFPNSFNTLIPNKYFIFSYILIISLLNYFLFIKDRKFLNYNFKNDKKGGYVIILYVVILALILIFFANKNREKIFTEREKARIENKQ